MYFLISFIRPKPCLGDCALSPTDLKRTMSLMCFLQWILISNSTFFKRFVAFRDFGISIWIDCKYLLTRKCHSLALRKSSLQLVLSKKSKPTKYTHFENKPLSIFSSRDKETTIYFFTDIFTIFYEVIFITYQKHLTFYNWKTGSENTEVHFSWVNLETSPLSSEVRPWRSGFCLQLCRDLERDPIKGSLCMSLPTCKWSNSSPIWRGPLDHGLELGIHIALQRTDLCHSLPVGSIIFTWMNSLIPPPLNNIDHRLNGNIEFWRPLHLQVSRLKFYEF